jgi:hypothetical protein
MGTGTGRHWCSHQRVAMAFLLGLASWLGMQPSVSVAATHTHTYLGNSVHRLSLMGSNGYRIRVSSYVSRIYHRISLTAEGNGAFARYSVQGVAKNGKIEAYFPGLGEVKVHFEPSSVKKLDPRPGCHLPKEVIETGTFVGTIRFTGEKGYTRINATRARGSIFKSKKETCQVPRRERSSSSPSASAGREPGGRIEEIDLSATAGAVHFSTSNVNGRQRSSFSVSAHESRSGMGIFRAIPAVSAKGAFEYDSEHLASATVTPPSPFLGEASYTGLRDPGAEGMFPGFGTEGVISGSLRVPLPGLGMARLAGTGVNASLSRSVRIID